MSLDARGGGAASPEAMMRVNELMSAPAATVAPGDSLHIADGMMSMGGVRHLPVVSNGALVGVISQRDILRAPGLLSHLLSTARTALRSLRVQDVMSVQLVTIGADAPVEEAAQKLLEHRVGCLPVVEAGALVGIVTTSDLLRAVAGPPEAAVKPSGLARVEWEHGDAGRIRRRRPRARTSARRAPAGHRGSP